MFAVNGDPFKKWCTNGSVEKMIERFRDVGFMVLSALFIKCRYGVFLDRIC